MATSTKKSWISEHVTSVAKHTMSEPAIIILAWRMAFWVVVVSLTVKFSSFPKLFKTLTPSERPRTLSGEKETQELLVRALDRVLRVDFLTFTTICWKRSAVLYRFLRLAGQPARLLVGVRKTSDGKLDGHAWVEIDGVPIAEKTMPQYSISLSYPPQA